MADDPATRFGPRVLKRVKVKGLSLRAPPTQSLQALAGDSRAVDPSDLEITVEFQLDLMSDYLKEEDLVTHGELNPDNRTLSLVHHRATSVMSM
jgi:hypothetical protein